MRGLGHRKQKCLIRSEHPLNIIKANKCSLTIKPHKPDQDLLNKTPLESVDAPTLNGAMEWDSERRGNILFNDN